MVGRMGLVRVELDIQPPPRGEFWDIYFVYSYILYNIYMINMRRAVLYNDI